MQITESWNNRSWNQEVFIFVKRLGLLAAVLSVSLTFCGCTAAYNARTVDSPDWKYAARCYTRGSLGRSYVAETTKAIEITIYALAPNTKERVEREEKEAVAAGVWRSDHNPGASVIPNDTLLFRKQYRIKGSAMEWSSVWGDQGALSIVFYDYGANVEPPYSAKVQEQVPKRLLRTLNFRLDPSLGVYKEEQ